MGNHCAGCYTSECVCPHSDLPELTPIGRAALIIAEAAKLNAHVAGMTALNQERIANGHAIAYDDSAFDEIRESFIHLKDENLQDFLLGKKD